MPTFTYTTRETVEANVQADLVVRACDRDNDGVEDAGTFDALVASVGTEVEALVAPSVQMSTLSSAPALLCDAALKIVCERLYRLLSTPPKDNPWKDDADEARRTLRAVGAGTLRLDAAQVGAIAQIEDDEDLVFGVGEQADL